MHSNTPESIHAKLGREIGVSDWIEITQDMVNRFADLTHDHQFIHVDAQAAAASPFGGTIAHGFLVLSLVSTFVAAADHIMQGMVLELNYGFEKVRFISPVRVGKRVRGRSVLKQMTERSAGRWLSTIGITIEIEGETKPAVVADWLGLQYLG